VELKAVISSHKPDVLCITETLPKGKHTNFVPFELDNLGYISFHSVAGRGISLYVKSEISPTQVDIDAGFTESLWISLTGDKKYSILLGCIYRSPNSTASNNDKLLTTLEKGASLTYDSMIIVGDFNYKEIDWRNNRVTCGINHPASMMYDKLNDLFLTQLINEPTRYRQGETPNILDWLVTDSPHCIDCLTIGPPLGEKGDHCTIMFDVTVVFRRFESGTNYCYNRANFNKMREALSKIDWQELLSDCDTQNSWDLFQERLTLLIEECVPRNKAIIHKSPPWFNKHIRGFVKEKNRA
jgi:hypothetical protein